VGGALTKPIKNRYRMTDNKILVTGSAGFIGYHLCKSLLNDNYDVLGIDNINDYYDVNLKKSRLNELSKNKNFIFKKIDIIDKEKLSKSFKEFQPNIVVNLAAQAGVRYSIENPYAYMDSNLIGFLNIIELCRQLDTDGFIYASSSSVYGKNKKTPFSEEARVDSPMSLYAATKRSNELIAYSYSDLYKLKTTGLRFFTAYGPWGRPDMALFIFTKNILDKKPIDVFNNGNMKRDFTYIDDIISGIRSAIDHNYKCEIFNIGNNRSEKLLDMISIIEKELNIKSIINFKSIQKGDVIESYSDIGKSAKMLGYKPLTSINKGIPLFIEWYKNYFL
tara:strand:+ start:302 stop:1303 length:1002 start_codon:yes stop_codon:yes gene_type:complete